MKVQKIWFQKERLLPHLKAGVNEAAKKRLKGLRQAIVDLLAPHRFISFEKQPPFYFDAKLGCLWLLYDFRAEAEEMFRNVAKLRVYAFRNWEMPTAEELATLAPEPLFREHAARRGLSVLSATPTGEGRYRTVAMGSGATSPSEGTHIILPVHRLPQRDIFSFIVAHSLVPQGIEGIRPKLKELYDLTVRISQLGGGHDQTPSMRALEKHFLEGDYIRARLPVMEPGVLHDMGKGLWELHQPGKPPIGRWVEVPLETPWEARNPELDLREGTVAIDFGTSSTVVACRENGAIRLLRVGMIDFFRKPTPEDYQNPTVLSFINLPDLLKPWRTEAFRPLIRWEDFHFSHEALNQLRANEADQRIVASILTGIKQQPLSEDRGEPLRITDQTTGQELEVALKANPAPVAGEPPALSGDDAFDPIELYAYYLGLFINHRANGLFLQYLMTFPITYPRRAKRRILDAFSRGLYRSLPLSLLGSPQLARFSVREEASEPAAYAACALEELTLEATPEGRAYAVFDFGGGSTDFDFGLYRLPTPEEEQQGYERVIQHFGASGDIFLGGENLVAHLVYLTFRDNLEVCREQRIPFALPPEGETFPGSEPFIENSHVAQTNSALLTAQLRGVWEDFQWGLDDAEQAANSNGKTRRLSDRIGDALGLGILDEAFRMDPSSGGLSGEQAAWESSVELLNRDREKVRATFRIDRNRLNRFLVQRVGKGILRFFLAMKSAFRHRGDAPEQIHILQAGNSSRSLLVQSLFAALLQERMFKWEPPTAGIRKNPALEEIRRNIPFAKFVVHRPPPGDPDNPYKPTAKTGVAIGLLKLAPGESLLALDVQRENASGEAPFSLFVGRLRNGAFQPVLEQNAPYGDWRELGVPIRGTFILLFTTSPQAGFGALRRGAPEVREKSLSFPPGSQDKRLFIQAVGPGMVEICLGESLAQIRQRPETLIHRETLRLQ